MHTRCVIKVNKPVSLQIGKGMNDRPRGQEVKGQGHRRPKLYLKAWWRHLIPWVE